MKSKREFHCKTDISEFIKDKDLKTKVVTADKRLTCSHRVEWQYYHAHDTVGNVNKTFGICAFCGCELKNAEIEQLTLGRKVRRVQKIGKKNVGFFIYESIA